MVSGGLMAFLCQSRGEAAATAPTMKLWDLWKASGASRKREIRGRYDQNMLYKTLKEQTHIYMYMMYIYNVVYVYIDMRTYV